jgi:polysaccharide deacetylase family protein (PEP-CTERM system associated)
MADTQNSIINAMSVDLEDYYQVWALSSVVKRAQWSSLESRVEASTSRILDMFDHSGTKATFFTLGCVAKDHPDLVRRIVASGHELASHGFWHHKVHELTQAEFLEDVRSTRLMLEDLGGVAVRGYRAPSFSISEQTPWAYDVLAEAGYTYSSSLHPIVHDHYGRPDAPRFPYDEASGIREIPVATIEWHGRRITCAGGGFFRLLPYAAWFRPLLRRLHAREHQPATFYFHPWEIDVGQPHMLGLPIRSRLRHYTNLGKMEGKLRRLLADFRWDRIDRVYGV